MNELKSLIEISRLYGDNPAFVIAGGGNTSYKDGHKIWIKAVEYHWRESQKRVL